MTAYTADIVEAATAADTVAAAKTLTAAIVEANAAIDAYLGVYNNAAVLVVNQPAPLSGSDPFGPKDGASKIWVRRIAETLNAALSGKLNVVLPVKLSVGAGTTTVIDPRIGPYSALIPLPTTANAAAACYETPYILPSSQKQGSVVLNHVSDSAEDKLINLVIIG